MYMKYQSTLVENISLKLFLTCMFLCAGLFIIAVWIEPPEAFMKSIFTIFVVGFASFLTWLPILLYKISKR